MVLFIIIYFMVSISNETSFEESQTLKNIKQLLQNPVQNLLSQQESGIIRQLHVYRLKGYFNSIFLPTNDLEIIFQDVNNLAKPVCLRIDKADAAIMNIRIGDSLRKVQKKLRIEFINSYSQIAPEEIVKLYNLVMEQDGLLYVFGGVEDTEGYVILNEILIFLSESPYCELFRNN